MLARQKVLKAAQFPRIIPGRNLKTTGNKKGGHAVRFHNWWSPEKAQGREVVGFGFRGDENYEDREDSWYPAIRFRVNDQMITPIREKELGDWKNISLEEKKLLYRYSFAQTMSEFRAPRGYSKVGWAGFFAVMGVCTLYSVFLQAFFYPGIDPVVENEFKESIYEKKVVMEKGRFLGPAADYDYENNRWKD